jgi:hypothetical protein
MSIFQLTFVVFEDQIVNFIFQFQAHAYQSQIFSTGLLITARNFKFLR